MKLTFAAAFAVVSAGLVSAGRLGGPSASIQATKKSAATPSSSAFTLKLEQNHRHLSTFGSCANPDTDTYNYATLVDGAGFTDLSTRLTIDQILDPSEFTGFITIPMFNGGKNNDGTTPQVAEAKLAYDCAAKKLCVSAYLTQCYLDGNAACDDGSGNANGPDYVIQSDSDSWISFGSGNVKLFGVTYLMDGVDTIGWEACWTLEPSDNPNKLGPLEFIESGDWATEIHFNRVNENGNTNTISTGKATGSPPGKPQKICGECPDCTPPSDPVPPVCMRNDCDGNHVADPTMDGQDCDPTLALNPPGTVEACGVYQCSAGNCVKATDKADGDSCIADDGSTYTCCGNLCVDDGTYSTLCGGDTCPTTCEDPILSPAPGPASDPSQPVAISGCSFDAVITDTTRTSSDCKGATSNLEGTLTTPPNGDVCGQYMLTWTPGPDCTMEDSPSSSVTYELSYPGLPTLNMPSDYDASCSDNDFGSPTASDSCGADLTPILSVQTQDGSDSCDSTTLRTYTVTDACGQTETKTQTIRVRDTEAPTDVTVADYTAECSSGNGLPADSSAFPTTTTGSASASDNCNAESITYSFTESAGAYDDPKCQYSFTRTWSADDGCGNVNQDAVTQTITIEDTQPPTVSAPADVSLKCHATNLDTSPTDSGTGVATAWDACSAVDALTITPVDTTISGSCDGNYTIQRSWASTDECERTSTAVNQIITVSDSDAPKMSVPADGEQQCGAPAVDFGTATAQDDCDGPIPAGSISSSDTVQPQACTDGVLKTTTRTWTAVDECGNSVKKDQIILEVDTVNPTIDMTSAPNVEQQCGAPLQPVGAATGSDDCDVNVDVTVSEDFADTFGTCGVDKIINTTVKTWTVTDDCSNSISAVQTITVVDKVAPELTVPGDVQQECGGRFVPTGSASATDTCTVPTVTSDSNIARDDGTCVDNVTKIETITFTATDACGNAESKDQVITTKDTTPPALTMPGNVVIECNDPNASTDPSYTGTATAWDACWGDLAATSYDRDTSPSSCDADKVISSIDRDWSSTDTCGLTRTLTQEIKTIDTLAPELENGPASEASFPCNSDCVVDGYVVETAECAGAPPTAADQCEGAITVTKSDSPKTDTLDPPGVEYTRTYSAIDSCGNSVEQTQTISIVDICEFPISDAFSGLGINVMVSIVNIAGGVNITIDVEDDNLVGDLRGVFFKVYDVSKITGISGPHVGDMQIDANGVTKVSNDVRMTGGGNTQPQSYNVGVEIGTRGLRQDDIDLTYFVVSGITTDDIDDTQQETGTFGIRLTSVGTGGNDREDSSKITGNAVCCRA
ncbi:von Willebrand factor, type A [Seminavis robusta]|uniref:von Willebrand factor, type A n=1 Tax=Seminavis robusta TaxID=568900 RepID=A0A9N8D9T6_9STRA|nr:von Willebrand factor, type A [Seminavis robusta]|eukprot:Sro10_g008340.1 von Willebrand factor, type A (1313) ;mRNA; r:202055-206473